MTEHEFDPILYRECSDVVDSLMARYGWRLIDRAEFARIVTKRVAANEFTNPNPAAMNHYCQQLYIACFGHEGAERQEIGFIELHSYLYALSFRMVADLPAETREDLMNETIARIWQRLASYRNPGAFLAVAAMELRNVLRPYWKRTQTQCSMEEVAEQLLASEGHDPVASSLDNDLRRQVQACFTEAYAQHPRAKKQIDAVRLTYLGYDDAAISAQLGTPVKNVYVLRSRGLDLLRKQPLWQQLAVDIGLLVSPVPIGGDRVCQ